jgi:ferredoxin-NADP reductase
MVAQATHDRTAHRLMLLHANRTLEDAPCQDEFRRLAKDNPYFMFVPVLTKMAPDDWQGERGHIDKAMLKRHIANLYAPIYYLTGPAGMVRAMRQLLVDIDVNEDNIRTEEFVGY